MKYMAIIYGNKEMWESFPPDVATKAIGEVDAFNRRYTASGELLGAYGLADERWPDRPGTRRRPGGDRRAVPRGEGVRVELLDARRREREAGAGDPGRAPVRRHNAVEVWPILHESGADV